MMALGELEGRANIAQWFSRVNCLISSPTGRLSYHYGFRTLLPLHVTFALTLVCPVTLFPLRYPSLVLSFFHENR